MRGHQSFSLFVFSRTTEEFPTYLSQPHVAFHSLEKNYVAVVFYVRRNLYYLHPMSYLVIRPSTHLFYQGNSSIFDIKKSYMIYKLTHFLLSLLSWDMSIYIKFELWTKILHLKANYISRIVYFLGFHERPLIKIQENDS